MGFNMGSPNGRKNITDLKTEIYYTCLLIYQT